MSDLLRVKIYSPFETYLESDKVESLTAANGTGQFDVLPGHQGLITILEPCELVVTMSQKSYTQKVTSGVLYVEHNAVTIFLNL